MSTVLDRIRTAQRQTREKMQKMRMPEYNGDRISKILQMKRKEMRAGPRVGPYRSMGRFMQDVATFGKSGERPPEMVKYQTAYTEYREKSLRDYTKKAFPTAMNESIMSDGGVFVPPQFANELLMRIYENDLLSRVRLFNQLSSNTLKIPAIDETSRAAGSRFGGVTSYMRQEGPPSAMTASKPKMSMVSLTVDTLYVFMVATDELLEDFPALESFATDIVAQEFQFRLGEFIVRGTGEGQPLGMLNSPSKKTIAKENGQVAATVLPTNVFKMWAGQWIGCRRNAVWLVSNNVWPQLFNMSIGNLPIFLPNHLVDGAPFSTLLGRPVIETEFNSDVGTEGDIMLADPTTYLFATKGDLRSFSSMHLYFDRGLQAFRFEMRIDGKSWWKSPLTLSQGSSNTVSNIVTLATRA